MVEFIDFNRTANKTLEIQPFTFMGSLKFSLIRLLF